MKLLWLRAVSSLIIEYPRTFDMHNLKKFLLFKTKISVTFPYEGGNKKFEGSGVIWDTVREGY